MAKEKQQHKEKEKEKEKMLKSLKGAEKEVLVEVVRFTQRHSLQGSSGAWKEYLERHDKQLGGAIADPARRPRDFLLAFLLSFPLPLQSYFHKRIHRINRMRSPSPSRSPSPTRENVMLLLSLTQHHPDYPRNYAFPSYQQGWQFIQLPESPPNMGSKPMIAIHCQTVLCTDGTQALVRICAVDQNLQVIMDRIVNPNKPVKNYKTPITGLSAEDLDGVTCSLADVQKSFKLIFEDGPILIGHRLFNDLQALRIDYPLVVDTACIFSYSNLATGVVPSLNNLCSAVLGEAMRKGCDYNYLEEAKTAMRLVLAKLEHGIDHPINIPPDSASNDTKLMALHEVGSKHLLMVHHVPASVPYLELSRIFPGNPEIHDGIKVQGNFYSTFVKFKDSNEADNAYEGLNGEVSQDSFGRLQKLIVFKRENGEVVRVYVRKVLNKRLSEFTDEGAQETKDTSKKLKMSHDQFTTEKKVLVEMVKKIQKLGLKGSKGNWTEFLESHDKQLGSRRSDPAKRDEETLRTFLRTFSPHLQKYFNKMRKRSIRLMALEEHIGMFPGSVSPELSLAYLTTQNLNYRRNYDFASHNEDWKVMKVGSVSDIIESKSVVAIDCEMVLCEDGSEAPVRVCAVDRNLAVLMDKLISPGKLVKDYRTHITGLSAEDLDGVTCTLANIQKSLRKILKKGTVLIGHSLFFDLRALKIDYPLVIDTTCIFQHADLPPGVSPFLNNLCKAVLGRAVREEGKTHECLDDAKASMELVLAKLQHGFYHPIKVAFMSESDLAKLKVHKVPLRVSCEELSSSLPGNPNVDKDIRVTGHVYATLVEFKNAMEAEKAFQELDGDATQDVGGRLQKLVSLRLRNGEMVSVYIRKMLRQ